MASVLVKELETFRVKITASANETFASWREENHDDLCRELVHARAAGDHLRQVPSVLKDFPLGDHDDGPDALEQALRLLID
jgi:hypothetical protein